MTTLRRRQLLVSGIAAVLAPLAGPGAARGESPASSVAFFRAVAVDNPSCVQRELERGLDPNTPSEYGQSALFLAIRDDSPRVAALLLAWPGVNLDMRNAAGETPLMIAALRGNVEVMTQLLDRGVPAHHAGWSPLHYAATGPSAAAVAALLARGAPIDAPSPNGSTPLMLAARYGAEASVDLLVERGADLTRRNERQLSAEDFARGADRDWMVRKLQALLRKRQSAPDRVGTDGAPTRVSDKF